MLFIDQINLTIVASRFGWSDEIQNELTNSALLIRKYQRRLRLIRMQMGEFQLYKNVEGKKYPQEDLNIERHWQYMVAYALRKYLHF